MVKILHIVHSLTSGGGLSNFVMNYYRNIDRTKIQFDFIYFKESEKDFKEEIIRLGGSFYKWDEPNLNRKYIKEAEEFFKNHKNEYIAIHCHALFAVAAYGQIARKCGIKNIIAHSHNTFLGAHGILRKARNMLFILCCRYTSNYKFACSSEAAIFMFGPRQYKKGKVKVISNAIDCMKYCYNEQTRIEVRKELKIPENSFVIGNVGGFAEQKNQEYLVDLLDKLEQKRSNYYLMLVGGEGISSGSTLRRIKKLVSDLGLQDKVIFTGMRSDVNRLLNGMDVFAFPSLAEGFGIVLVEAQSNGLKCVASTNVPVTAKCTENVEYIDLKDKEAWINAIDISKNYDRSVCIEDFKSFDIHYQVKVLQDIYLSI